MKEILVLAGLLVALALLRRIVPFLLGRFIGGVLGRAVGDHALAQQPDVIHLSRAGSGAWRDAAAARALAARLTARGFEDAGVHRIEEMPDVTVQLLVRGDESLMAAVYEHPKVGHWLDVAARYQDGTSITFSSAAPTGLEPRPGHPVVNAPGSDASALYDRARRDMPKRPLRPASTETVGLEFERSYAESIAWRKKKRVSAREVAEVARNIQEKKAA